MIVAGLVISRTGWLWVDPAVSLAIVAIIFAGTWGLLRESVSMSLDAVPAGIDPNEVESSLASMPGVEKVHDLHIWPMSTTEIALTCHLVIPGGRPGDEFLKAAAEMLHERYTIDHTTIQIEIAPDASCGQAAQDSV